MARIYDIIERARDVLADPRSERWSDAVLLRFIDDAHKDVAIHSKILKDTYIIPLEANQPFYQLPDNVWMITRATFNNSFIGLYSHDYLDELAVKQAVSDRSYERNERKYGSSDPIDNFSSSNWEIDTSSEINALIYDRRNMNSIRTYPIPNDDIISGVSGADTEYGVMVEYDNVYDTFDTVFGVFDAIEDASGTITSTVDEDYGVTIGGIDTKSIKIWYIRVPTTIREIQAPLETPPMFDKALRYYVIAQAFMLDLDTRYKEKAADYMSLYQRELGKAVETDLNDAARKTYQETTYRTGFE